MNAKKEWKEKWGKNKELLENLLKSHNVPENEYLRIMDKFNQGLKDYDSWLVMRCIDQALGWHGSHFSYDFYHFLQMRFAYYMCFYAPENDKREIARYLRDLLHYTSGPDWVHKYKDAQQAKINNEKGDLIMPRDIYRVRKDFYKQKSKILSEKFGIKE